MTINKSRLYHTHWQIKRINDPLLFPPNIFLSNAPNLHEQGAHQVAERDPRGNHMASARGHPSSRPCSRGPDQGSPFSLSRLPADKNEFLIHNFFICLVISFFFLPPSVFIAGHVQIPTYKQFHSPDCACATPRDRIYSTQIDAGIYQGQAKTFFFFGVERRRS